MGSRCRAKFGAEVKDIAEDLGLKDALKEHTVFERLYDDAIDRVHRLEKLRAKVNAERKTWHHDGETSPRSAAGILGKQIGVASQGSVLEAVENSPLTGLQSLVKDKDSAPTSLHTQKKSSHLLPPLVKFGGDAETSTEDGNSSRNTPRSRASSRTVSLSPAPSVCQIDLGVDCGRAITAPGHLPGARRRPSIPRRM